MKIKKDFINSLTVADLCGLHNLYLMGGFRKMGIKNEDALIVLQTALRRLKVLLVREEL